MFLKLLIQVEISDIQKEIIVTDRVYSSCSWPGSGGKNFTDSLKSVFAGPVNAQADYQCSKHFLLGGFRAKNQPHLLLTCFEMGFVGSSQT